MSEENNDSEINLLCNINNFTYNSFVLNNLIQNLSENKFNILYLNARSLISAGKLKMIEDFICDIGITVDAIAVSESWVKDDQILTTNLHGFQSFFSCRSTKGGGCATFVGNHLKTKVTEKVDVLFYLLLNEINVGSFLLKFGSIYRPPLMSRSEINDFLVFLDGFLSKFQNSNLLICGDFNLNTVADNDFITRYKSIILSNGFNIVNTSFTRLSQTNTLIDHIITNINLEISVHTFPFKISDHNAIICQITLEKSNIYSERIVKVIDYNQIYYIKIYRF